MNIDYNKLGLQVQENNITNTQEVLSYLNEIEMSDELSQYLETLLNKLKYTEIANKEELINALSAKLLQFQTAQQEISNLTTLRAMQEKNEELKKLNVVETRKENNDSNLDIDYLTFTNRDGKVEVLICENKNTLNNFLKDHAENIASISAEEIFNYLKNYVHVEVKFSNQEEFNNSELNNQAIIRDEETQKAEIEMLEDYSKKYGLTSKIELTVDSKGERLYRIGDGLFKFKTVDSKRTLETLVQPSIEKDNTLDLMNELEEEPKITIDVKTENYQTTINENYDSIEMIDYTQFNKEDFIDITRKRDIYEIELTSEELHRLNVYIKFLISTMVEREKNHNSDYELEEMLVSYMESGNHEMGEMSIMSKYEEILNGSIPENSLSDLDKQFASKYKENLEYIKSLNLEKKKEKILEYKPINENKSGVANLVILLEIAALAIFILMFLSLDI